ncbi:hypothetical protein C8R45DRAFT_1040923 [Mycena sanguinolenta]|nr:hypothetical protein C8R45DRAFT_1040923 [Mycena sanguinolenta]
MWAYFPLIFITSILGIYISFLYWTCSSNLRALEPADTITKICRVACILFHVLLLVSFSNSGLIMVALAVFGPFETKTNARLRFKIAVLIVNMVGTLTAMYWTYSTCQRTYYEKVIMRTNAQKYGDPVLVCIPVFKLCGHFVLYTSTHKYELRLERTTYFRPYFLHRPLLPSEQDFNLHVPQKYHLFICGWTSRTHEDIVGIFNAAIREFGTYNRLTNNCRTFLQRGCMGILDLTSVWHEDLLHGLDPARNFGAWEILPLAIWQMATLIYRFMLRDLCRWVFSWQWGRDWESRVRYEGGLVDMADHDVTPRAIYEEFVAPNLPASN